MAWHKLKSMFVVSDAPAPSGENPDDVLKNLEKYQLPQGEAHGVLQLESAVDQDLAAGVGLGAHERRPSTLPGVASDHGALSQAAALDWKQPGDWRKTHETFLGDGHPRRGRMRRTATAVVLALSLGLLAVGCSKDPSTPGYWEDQLDAAQRPSEKVRVLETLRSSKRLR